MSEEMMESTFNFKNTVGAILRYLSFFFTAQILIIVSNFLAMIILMDEFPVFDHKYFIIVIAFAGLFYSLSSILNHFGDDLNYSFMIMDNLMYLLLFYGIIIPLTNVVISLSVNNVYNSLLALPYVLDVESLLVSSIIYIQILIILNLMYKGFIKLRKKIYEQF